MSFGSGGDRPRGDSIGRYNWGDALREGEARVALSWRRRCGVQSKIGGLLIFPAVWSLVSSFRLHRKVVISVLVGEATIRNSTHKCCLSSCPSRYDLRVADMYKLLWLLS